MLREGQFIRKELPEMKYHTMADLVSAVEEMEQKQEMLIESFNTPVVQPALVETEEEIHEIKEEEVELEERVSELFRVMKLLGY